jgi:hypothetical protein
MIIDSRIEVLPGLLQPRDTMQLKNEPMLFNCDRSSADWLGGPITREFLGMLPDGWGNGWGQPIVVDSRVHMLMPGWYPCIPGWHHDDVPRTREDGQPNYGPGQNRSEHIMALVNGDVCPTHFAVGKAVFKMPPPGSVIYSHWHRDVEWKLQEGELTEVGVPTNRLVRFDDRSWHRGTKAAATGWRLFIRASRYFSPDGDPVERGNKRTNEVRNQVQVYMDSVNAGW